MSNSMSQEEIDRLLGGFKDAPAEPAAAPVAASPVQDPFSGQHREILTPEEADAIGEVGNISMGTAATTLNKLLGKRVSITTPRVSVSSLKDFESEYPIPFVVVEVLYTEGLEGTNLLFLKEEDVKVITDLLMGGDGTNTAGELSELHLSAISEVMNQMVGSSVTSIANMINTVINISPPRAYYKNLADDGSLGEIILGGSDEPVIKVCFTMEIEGLIVSELMQLMPVDFCKVLVAGLMGGVSAVPAPEPPPAPVRAPAPEPVPVPVSRPVPSPDPVPAYDFQPAARSAPAPAAPPVNVKPPQYAAFDDPGPIHGEMDNIDLLMDVPLQVTVELGKSKKYIKEILDFNLGSIVVLDKLAGEPVDIVVNGKLIAKGEVVVIDDSYGARITDIVTPSKRISGGR